MVHILCVPRELALFWAYLFEGGIYDKNYKFGNSNTNIKSIVSNTKILRIRFKKKYENHNFHLSILETTTYISFHTSKHLKYDLKDLIQS